MTSACNSQQITNNNLENSSCKVTADDHCKYLLFTAEAPVAALPFFEQDFLEPLYELLLMSLQ